MSPSKKTIVVVGATGRCGRSVVASLLPNPEFHVKATTRDTGSAKAKYIESLGAEVVKADSWNPTELDKALAGAWGVYLNTNSEAADFVGDDGPSETDMGKNVIDAARRQGVEVFIYASLPDAYKITDGNVQIKSFFHKTNISNHAMQAGFKSASNVNVGWMMENFWNPVYEKPFGGFARWPDAEGYLTIQLFHFGNDPEETPFTSIRDDYGDIVHGVFLDPQSWDKQTVWAVSHPLSFAGVAEAYNRVTGDNKARFAVKTEPTKAATPEKAKEVNGVRNYAEYVKGNWCDGKPLDQTPAKKLKAAGAAARGAPPEKQRLQTFEGFIREHAFKGEDM